MKRPAQNLRERRLPAARRRSRFESGDRALLGVILVSIFVIAGCTKLAPINPTQPFELGQREGLLILDVETEADLVLVRLGLEGRLALVSTVLRNAAKGRHVMILRAKEGTYRWMDLKLKSRVGRPFRYQIAEDPEYVFDVVAGKVNYPGELLIHVARTGILLRGFYERGPDLIIRNRNRAGRTLRALEDSYGHILRRFELRHAAGSKDRFFEYYRDIRDRVSGGSDGDGEGLP